MSFFYDFLDLISIDDLTDKICCNIVFGEGVKVVANFKIEDLKENEIVLKIKKTRIKIFGKELTVLTYAKGEIEIKGKIDGVVKVW